MLEPIVTIAVAVAHTVHVLDHPIHVWNQFKPDGCMARTYMLWHNCTDVYEGDERWVINV